MKIEELSTIEVETIKFKTIKVLIEYAAETAKHYTKTVAELKKALKEYMKTVTVTESQIDFPILQSFADTHLTDTIETATIKALKDYIDHMEDKNVTITVLMEDIQNVGFDFLIAKVKDMKQKLNDDKFLNTVSEVNKIFQDARNQFTENKQQDKR